MMLAIAAILIIGGGLTLIKANILRSTALMGVSILLSFTGLMLLILKDLP